MPCSLPLAREQTLLQLIQSGQVDELRTRMQEWRVLASTVLSTTHAPLLSAAVQAQRTAVCQLLLREFGADANAASALSCSPLLDAVRVQHADIVAALLAAGADVHWSHARPFFAALACALPDVATALVRLMLPHVRAVSTLVAADGSLPLHAAARSNLAEVVAMLLAAGADPHQREPDGSTALHWACRQSAGQRCAQLLLDAGCDVNAASQQHMTPLMRVGSPRTAEMLLERGALVDAADVDGWTPLFWCVLEGDQRATIRVLVRAGANVARRGHDGESALQRAVKWGNCGNVCALLAFGADPNQIDANGRSPLSHCKVREIAALLVAAGAQLPTGCTAEVDAMFADVDVPAALRSLQIERFLLVRQRASEVSVALQSLQLPALLTVLVLYELCESDEDSIPMHFMWRLSVAVKHFGDPRKKTQSEK
jgi:ankyrin repeat protein